MVSCLKLQTCGEKNPTFALDSFNIGVNPTSANGTPLITIPLFRLSACLYKSFRQPSCVSDDRAHRRRFALRYGNLVFVDDYDTDGVVAA